MVKGKGINMPTEGDDPMVGFFAVRVVRASSSDQAIDKVKSMVTAEWTTAPYADANQGQAPALSVEEVWPDTMLRALFFKNTGHVFYTDSEDESEA